MADTGKAYIISDPEFLDGLANNHLSLCHGHCRRREIVIDNDHHPIWIEELLDAEFLECHGAAGKRIMRHDPVHGCGHVLTCFCAFQP